MKPPRRYRTREPAPDGALDPKEIPLDVKLTRGTDGFDLAEWPVLLATDPYRNIFATPQWSRVWWEEFGAGKQLLVLTFSDPDPVGLACLVLDPPSGTLAFLGGDDLTDYMGPVSAGPEHLSAIAEALVTYAVNEIPGWTCLSVRCMPVPFGFAEWLVEAADRLGLHFEMDEHEMTAVLALPDSFDAYLDQLGKHRRHELRRKLRRFDEAAGDARLVTAGPETLEADLGRFFGMHRQSAGDKGRFMGLERASFFERIAREFAPAGLLCLDFLEVAGKPVASTFSFPYAGSFNLYNSAFDAGSGAISPGIVICVRLIARCIEQKMGRFDFLRGTERYKFDLGAERLPLHAVTIDRPGRDDY